MINASLTQNFTSSANLSERLILSAVQEQLLDSPDFQECVKTYFNQTNCDKETLFSFVKEQIWDGLCSLHAQKKILLHKPISSYWYNEAFSQELDICINKFIDAHVIINPTPHAQELIPNASESTVDAPDEILAVLNRLGLKAEKCGSWLWVAGATQTHRPELEAAGLKWSFRKGLWYHCPETSKSHSYKYHQAWSMDQIRTQYGSEALNYKQPSLKECG